MKEEPLGSELREKLAAWRIEADLPRDFQQRVWKRIAMHGAANSHPPWLRWFRSPLTSATRLSVPRFPLTAVVARPSLRQVIASLLAPNPMIRLWKWWSSRSQSSSQVQSEPFVTRAVGQLFISLYGDLHNAQSEVIVRFRDSNGQLKDVGEVKTDLSMNLSGGIVMHSRSDVSKTSTAGIYRAKLQPQMAGDWVVNLSWKGAVGEGQVEMPVTVKQ